MCLLQYRLQISQPICDSAYVLCRQREDVAIELVTGRSLTNPICTSELTVSCQSVWLLVYNVLYIYMARSKHRQLQCQPPFSMDNDIWHADINCSLASQHTVEDGPRIPLATTPPTTGRCFPRGKEGTAPHAVPDAVHNHGDEGGCCCSSVQHLEHCILAVLVLLCK